MLTLRTTLIVLGVVLVLGVYLLGVRPRRRRRAASYRRTGRSALALKSVEDSSSHPESRAAADEFAESPAIALRGADEVRIDDLPVIRHESSAAGGPGAKGKRADARRSARRQIEFDFAEAKGRADEASAAAGQDGELLILYVRATDTAFSGRRLLAEFESAGLEFGDMRIFHHYGAGAMRAPIPLFSVANMFEPGHLEIDDPERFSTQGLVMFLQALAQFDNSVAFELFVNTAGRLAERLDAQLWNAARQPLTKANIDGMRQRACQT